MIWRFADCELSEERYELRRRGRAAKLEPRVFDVLLHLLRHRERVVSKEELLEAFWPGVAVSDTVLPRCITAARRAVGDDRSRGRVIQTVHGRGYRFVATAEASAAVAPPAPASGPAFVGREDALHSLQEGLDRAVAGHGRVALIVGEPGIGKTRTLEEVGAEARRRGMRWLAGRCWEAEGAPAFWPFLQVLRGLAPRRASRGGRGVEIASLGTFGAAEGEQARFQWFDAVATQLRDAASLSPLLVSIDDLHWADADSLRLFLFLARELGGAAVLLVGTYRDVEVRRGHALARLLGDLAREPRVDRVALRGLAPEEAESLAAAVAGGALDRALAKALVELTDGNPFFLQEMARWLRDSGRLHAGGAPALSLPQGIRDALGRRLDALSEASNALLRVAAVIGREFAAALLAEVAGVERVLESLSEAADHGIVVEDEETRGHFAFSHALLRQTLYEELPVAQRVALHRRVAEALTRTNATAASELAHHFFEALPSGTAEDAVHTSVSAAEAAHERLAYDESARHYRRALEALGFIRPVDDGRRAALLVALGEELWTGGGREAGRARLAEAADLARRLGRADLLARAAIGYRGFGEMGMPPDPKTLGLLEEARDALGAGHPILRSRLLARLAGTPPYSTSMAKREELAREAWRLAEGSDDPAAIVDAIGARYWATLGPDRLEDRLAVARDSLALAESSGDRRLALLGHEVAIGHHLVRGDLDAADREIDAYARIADEIRQPVFRFLAGLIRGSRALGSGDFEQAEHWIREAHVRGRGTIPYADIIFASQVLVLFFLRGEVERMAEIALSLGDEVGRRFAGAGLLNQALGVTTLLQTGRREEARRGYEAFAAHDFADLERDEHWLLAMRQIADLAIEFEDRRRGEILYDALLPYRTLMVSHDLLRLVAETVESVLGSLALLAGGTDRAIAHYEQARERAEGLGLRPALGVAELGLARALAQRAGRGDRARARRLLARLAAGPPSLARRRAESLGVPPGSARGPNLKKSSARRRDPKRSR